MKTARRYTGDGVEINIELGNRYEVIKGITSPSRFNEIWKEQFAEELPEDNTVEAFIVGAGEKEPVIIPVYGADTFYIVSANGQTYSKVQSRK